MQERRLCATRPGRDGDMFALVNQVGTVRAFIFWGHAGRRSSLGR